MRALARPLAPLCGVREVASRFELVESAAAARNGTMAVVVGLAASINCVSDPDIQAIVTFDAETDVR